MLIRILRDIRYSEITPREVYLNRRRFLAASGGALAAAIGGPAAGGSLGSVRKSPLSTTGEQLTPKETTTSYNNFYEFGTGKEEPSHNAARLKTKPWKVKIDGQCNKPRTFDIGELLALASMEERVYRHRCVEAWSIVVPWNGYSLAALLKQAEPNSKAKYVAFESYYDSGSMLPSQFAGVDFPYREGLRLDEAMHPLTLLCFGMYGDILPNQDGAPVRLVVPGNTATRASSP